MKLLSSALWCVNLPDFHYDLRFDFLNFRPMSLSIFHHPFSIIIKANCLGQGQIQGQHLKIIFPVLLTCDRLMFVLDYFRMLD